MSAPDIARWRRVQELFHAALELAPPDREACLRTSCGGDAALLAEVLELLAEDARGSATLDSGLAPLAGALLGEAAPREAFGPYSVRSVLGEGGMGVVYLAERDDLGTRVAIKVLRDAWLSPARRARFAAEQRTLARLRHAAIAQLHDAGTLPDGTPYFVMEYVEGLPLTRYCRAHGTSLEGRLELFRAVCAAVQHAHDQAVIHRDLKPSNILVGADGRVKLLDFGIARQLESLDAAADPTVTALRLLTPAYAAPEQLRGEPVGIRGDVYSLGLILYELLAGRPPWDLPGGTSAQAVAQSRERPPERLSATPGRELRARAADRTAWADLDVLCRTAMHPDPARRYPTVEALARDVERYLADEPLQARPDSLAYRWSKLARRHRGAVRAAMTALGAILFLAVFYTRRLAAARDEALAEAARAARIQRFMLSLFEGGDEAAGPAEDLRVLALLERGVQEARALDAEPAAQAELLRTLASLYAKLGDHERADALLAAVLERSAPPGPRPAERADTLVQLGLLRLEQARLEEAEQLVRDGLRALRRELPQDHPAVVRATAALGQVLEARGDYAGAIAATEEAVRLSARRGEDGAEHAALLGQLADGHFYAGQHDVADALNLRVLEAVRRVHGEAHPRVADVLINLGASQSERGRYAEAEARYREALALLEEFHGPEHFRVASAGTMLGRALVYQGRFDEGVPLLERALAIQERVHGPAHPRVASALNDLGSAALQQGDLEAAQAHFQRTLDIQRQVHAGEHYLQGIALSNLGSVRMERGDFAGAEPLYREALGLFERTLPPAHVHTAVARIKLGRALLRQARPAEAERETLAGYVALETQASPSVSWLRAARQDLVAAYEALGQPERAAPFREPEGPQRSP